MNYKFWNCIHGWFDFAELYDNIIKSMDEGICVEIGAWLGKSTAYMANNIMKSGKRIDFYTVDTWRGSTESKTQKKIAEENNNNLFPVFWNNMQKLNVENYVKPIQLESTAVGFPDLSIDFVFIDASHLYEAVLMDLKHWYPKVKKGGIIAGHDYDPRFGVIQAVNEFFQNGVEIFSPHNKLADSWIYHKETND